MDNKRVVPITRINKFFSEEDFNLEIEMGREAIEGDGNFTLILYRIDRQLTEYDGVYGEASKDGIRFFPPVELKVIPILAEPENKAYNSNNPKGPSYSAYVTFSKASEASIAILSLDSCIVDDHMVRASFGTTK